MRKYLINLWSSIIEELGTKREAQCGHTARRVATIFAVHKGHMYSARIIQWPRLPGAWVEYCADCLAEMTISCGWCDRPIFPGDDISIQPHPRPGTYPIPKHAALFSIERQQYVGCMDHHETCSDSALDSSQRGRWVPSSIRIQHAGRSRYTGCVELMSRRHIRLRPERYPLKLPDSFGTLKKK